MLIDTSGLLCLFNPKEFYHEQALALVHQANNKIITSYVLAEFVPLALVRGLPRKSALEFLVSIQESSEFVIIYVDETLHKIGVQLLEQRLDKNWSLYDAISMILMEEYQITEVLTTDHHFEQAGFRRLLK